MARTAERRARAALDDVLAAHTALSDAETAVAAAGAAKAAAGPVLARAIAAARDAGISDDFINSVKQRVTPGTSALFVLSSDAVIDRIKDTFKDTKAELIASNLSAEQEAKLREVFTEE